ncbi:MAG: hypothetical protein KIT84_10835 [Labilithrix sp.]|nr:hypothetical protein [Labilithrix sp.]MCW5811502.1 hypothetical protein [Labilithrix sp.]
MKTLNIVLAGLTTVVVAAAATGCSAPELEKKERRSSTTSALGKPKPTLKTAASKETTAQYGITEWRMFRGKKDLFMTGYDDSGKAVKGVSLSFEKAEDSDDAELVTHINDGSGITAARNLATQSLASDAIPADSADFIQQVAGDLGNISGLLGGELPEIGEEVVACGANLAAVCQLALQCCAGLWWGKPGDVDSCWAAAKAAVGSAAQCAQAAVDIAGGIDLSHYKLPKGTGHIDIGAILGGHVENPFSGAGVAALANPFGATRDLVVDAETGDVDFDNTEE